jgi:hypothetical protein
MPATFVWTASNHSQEAIAIGKAPHQVQEHNFAAENLQDAHPERCAFQMTFWHARRSEPIKHSRGRIDKREMHTQ